MANDFQNDYAVAVATGPAAEPVTLNEAKLQCAVEVAETYWNADLTSLIAAAREYVENRANVSLVTQTLRLYLPRFPVGGRDRLYLPRGPVQSLSKVEYTNAAGDYVDIVDDCQLSAGYVPAFIVPNATANWPAANLETANPVRVEYVAGYGDPSAVPQVARRLVLLLVGHWFRYREAVQSFATAQVEMAAEALFAQLSPGDHYFQFGQCVQ